MRTLKKSLALVLALVMVLGLGVIGASADNALDNYTDASEIGDAYYEAVGVLTGLGIIDGMTETTIEPTGTYTREQAAKIIATMVLGVKNAESLTCVEAPFDDVPADRWSAGYIAFCVEQGIIDGMTDTTFEPTGTLTGFQWAKMLLAAVGFGANGEFTGTSWSLNTARVAHEAGLFTGDLSGADHVNLSRQQAALYAFNTLTEIKQVSYSANNDNYIYGLQGYDFVRDHVGGSWWADGTGYTLGWSVFDLKSAAGIITNNEGTGADNTRISSSYKDEADVAKIDADTDIYDMWHAVRVWYVADGVRATTGDAVFVMDFAKVTDYDCANIEDGEEAFDDLKAAQKKGVNGKLGTENKDAVAYEYDLIDNTALDTDYGFAEITFYFDQAKLGARSASKDTTVVNNGTIRPAVDNDDIWTDISEIGRGDKVNYIVEGGQYYIYVEGVTAGAVKEITKTGVITLTDDTVLEPSAFVPLSGITAAYTDILGELLGEHDNPNYSFDLDSHGHWYAYSTDAYRTVAYFTGATKLPDGSKWDVDYDYMAQFVDVATKEIEEIPVTAEWYQAAIILKFLGRDIAGYYDITDAWYAGDEVYEPVPVGPEQYFSYYFAEELDVTASASRISVQDEDGKATTLVFDNDDVTYYIANDSGEGLTVDEYTGNAELIADYNGTRPASTVTLENIAVVTVKSDAGNDAVTVIFAYDGAKSVTAGTLFFDHDLTSDDWTKVTDSYYVFDGEGIYLDGSAIEGTDFDIIVKADNVSEMNRDMGFYYYTLDAETGLLLSLEQKDFYTLSDSEKFDADDDGDKVWLNGDLVSDDVTVADVREDPDDEIDDIDELADFMDSNDYGDDVPVVLVYTLNSDDEVDVIYVLDNEQANAVYTVEAKFDAELGEGEHLAAGTTIVSVTPDEISVWDKEDEVSVTVRLHHDSGISADLMTNFVVKVGDTTYTAVEVEQVAGSTTDVTFTVKVPGNTDSVILLGSYN